MKPAKFYLHIQFIPGYQRYFIVGTRWFTITLDYLYGSTTGRYQDEKWSRFPAWVPAFQWHPSGYLPIRTQGAQQTVPA